MKLDIQKLKPLLGISVGDTEKDHLLEFTLGNVTEIILNYCNIKELPKGLEYTAYRMAADLYHNEQLGCDSIERPVSSMSEGDLSISFSGTVYEASYTDSLLKNYGKQLGRYRRMLW